jgi:putative tricarboxylic transport membrane protein
MKALDQASSLFWLLVSLAVLIQSTRLGIGSLHDPGMGFLTFGASGLLGLFSIALFIIATLRKGEQRAEPFFSGPYWKRVIFVLFALVVWSWIMPELGYLISTFVLMFLLYWILEKKKIWAVLLSSVLTTGITYLVFSKWLNCQFPRGLFGF